VKFAGLDLAWSARNTSGGVVLELVGGVARPVVWRDDLGPDREILEFLLEGVGPGPALVAVDAPLVVPNETGTRPCDLALSRAYRKVEAGALPANRHRLGPQVRGEELVKALTGEGFVFSPMVRPRRPMRQVIEVYPHPAAVELFGLEKTLKYKARKGRSPEGRRRELARYRELLRTLEREEPTLSAGTLLDELPIPALRGRDLKRTEDLLDALFCAYIALYLWWYGPTGYRTFGDAETGFILVPMPARAPGTHVGPG